MTNYEKIKEIMNEDNKSCIIRHKKTGEEGVVSINEKGKIWVFYGASDGSDDKEITEKEFDENFEIIGEE